MPERLWESLSAGGQDAALLLALLLPGLLVGFAVTAGYRPGRLAGALLWRTRWTSLVFVLLIAASVGLGIGLTAQERGLRQGSARAAEKFDLIVAAPGSPVDMLLASVFLQPSDAPLLDGATMARIAEHPEVALAAPLAYGDSYRSHPVVGTTAAFVAHLAGPLAEGRPFAAEGEAVLGARVPLFLGARFEPAHGLGPEAEEHAHAGHGLHAVGRMAPTGSPWDKAILVPVETVWEVHGLARGHAPGQPETIGPPFDPDYFPGTPAILVRAEALWANYALKSEFTGPATMAFFPGAVLAQLHGLLGDVRQVMSVMALLTQGLVAAGVLAALVVLARLFARRFALLRALGAPRRFVFAVVWCHAAGLIAAGAGLGLLVGFFATAAISAEISRRSDILVTARLGWPELHLVAGFLSVTVCLALLAALQSLRRPPIEDLRG